MQKSPPLQISSQHKNGFGHTSPPPPLRRYPLIDELVGAEVYIKHENYQPNGSFKVRGGISVITNLDQSTLKNGLVAASTGNHGQSVSNAGKIAGVPVRIIVPVGANPDKIAAMQQLGAQVTEHGEKFDDAIDYAEHLAETEGLRYIHAGNEPDLIAGVATETLEIMQEVPDMDAVIVPIGGGSGASGACLVANAINPNTRVIGVQAASSPAAYESWKAKKILSAPNKSTVEGVATGRAFELPQAILQKYLSDFRVYDDAVFDEAVYWLLAYAHTLAEPAGAAALGAAYQLRESLAGKKVAVICCSSNITTPQLQRIIETYH